MLLLIVFFYLCFLSNFCSNVFFAQSMCYTPPMECPNKNITFWLYTRANRNNPHQVTATNFKSIQSAPWVKNAPIKVLIHGYTGHKNFSPNTEIRPAYMQCCDYNILTVDYNPIAREPCYMEAARNTELVGKCTAQLIDEMVMKHNFSLKYFHVIGFSLGGQTAGFVGNYIASGLLKRITALDPAMPLYVTTDKNKKVDQSDAEFVDIVHTNALGKGKLEATGHVDFFPNGGMAQPGCKATEKLSKASCDHDRAPIYYAESIITKIGFYGNKCYSWITYMIGWCELLNSSEEILFGEHVPRNATGAYFFSTNDSSPYALGSNRKTRKEKKAWK